jgi:hypothetical protein
MSTTWEHLGQVFYFSLPKDMLDIVQRGDVFSAWVWDENSVPMTMGPSRSDCPYRAGYETLRFARLCNRMRGVSCTA